MANLTVTEEMKVTIAARPRCSYWGSTSPTSSTAPPLPHSLPSSFNEPRQVQHGSWIIHENRRLAGQAWRHGPIVLAWDEVLRLRSQ